MSDEFFSTLSSHAHLLAYVPSSQAKSPGLWAWGPLVCTLLAVLTSWVAW